MGRARSLPWRAISPRGIGARKGGGTKFAAWTIISPGFGSAAFPGIHDQVRKNKGPASAIDLSMGHKMGISPDAIARAIVFGQIEPASDVGT